MTSGSYNIWPSNKSTGIVVDARKDLSELSNFIFMIIVYLRFHLAFVCRSRVPHFAPSGHHDAPEKRPTNFTLDLESGSRRSEDQLHNE